MVSALTMLGLPEFAAREASYARLAELIRERFADPKNTLQKLFKRITFNISSARSTRTGIRCVMKRSWQAQTGRCFTECSRPPTRWRDSHRQSSATQTPSRHSTGLLAVLRQGRTAWPSSSIVHTESRQRCTISARLLVPATTCGRFARRRELCESRYRRNSCLRDSRFSIVRAVSRPGQPFVPDIGWVPCRSARGPRFRACRSRGRATDWGAMAPSGSGSGRRLVRSPCMPTAC